MDLNTSLTAAELGVTTLGFAFAVWQLWATRSAVERTEARVKVNELLYELPQLNRLEKDLDDAARKHDLEGTLRALNDWRRQAGTVSVFLTDERVDEDLLAELKNSIALAGQAKNALVNGKENPLAVTEDTRTSVEKVCRDLPQVATVLRAKMGDEEQT